MKEPRIIYVSRETFKMMYEIQSRIQCTKDALKQHEDAIAKYGGTSELYWYIPAWLYDWDTKWAISPDNCYCSNCTLYRVEEDND